MREKTKVDELREKIAEVDRLRRWSREAESARGSIRAFNTPRREVVSVGFFASFMHKREYQPLSREVTDAIYQALAVVRDDYHRQAEALAAEIEAEHV